MSKYKYNLKPDKKDERDYLYKNVMRKQKLPSKVSLIGKLPEVYKQGDLGSCQSQGIGAIVSYIHNNNFDPSRLFTYYNVRKVMGEEYINQDCGGTLADTCKAVAKYGICDSKYWQYDISKFTEEPPKIAYDNATSNVVYTYYRLQSIDEIKTALANGHLIEVGVTVTESFESEECLTTGIIPAPEGKVLGGHAMVCVAYSDDTGLSSFVNHLFNNEERGYLYLRNSWGTHIPDEMGKDTNQILGLPECPGYFKISYENFKKIIQDMWIIVK